MSRVSAADMTAAVRETLDAFLFEAPCGGMDDRSGHVAPDKDGHDPHRIIIAVDGQLFHLRVEAAA